MNLEFAISPFLNSKMIYIYINIFFSGLFFCDRLLESATVVMSGLLCFLEGFF